MVRVGADTQLPGLVSVDRMATTDPVAVTVPVLLQLFAAAMSSRVAGMDLMAASGGESPRAVRMEDAVCTILAIASQLNTAPDATARSTIFPRIAADSEAVVVLICEVFEVALDRAPTTVSSCVFALSLVLVLVFVFASARSMAFPKLPMMLANALALQQLASLGVVAADVVASYTRAAPVASHEASANAPPPFVISPHVATNGLALHRVMGCRVGRKD